MARNILKIVDKQRINPYTLTVWKPGFIPHSEEQGTLKIRAPTVAMNTIRHIDKRKQTPRVPGLPMSIQQLPMLPMLQISRRKRKLSNIHMLRNEITLKMSCGTPPSLQH